MESSRLTTYHKTTYPHRKRTIRLRGSFEDNGKYIRCWNCHFIVNVDRDLGDPERSGNYETDAYVYADPLVTGGTSPVSLMEEVSTIGTIIDPNATYYTPRLPQVSKGCPFCGCTNLL